MPNQLSLAFAALSGVLAGALLLWGIMRRRIADATQQGKSDVQVELATLQERLRATADDGLQLRAEHERLQQLTGQLRSELEAARHDNAQLAVSWRRTAIS